MADEVTADDVVGVVSGLILAGPDDDVWDNIFDWIQNSTQQIINTVTGWINSAVSRLVSAFSTVVSVATSGIKSLVNYIYSGVSTIQGYITNIYYILTSLWSNLYSTVSSAISSAITTVHSWIATGTSTLTSWISTQSERVIAWVTSAVSTVTATVQALISEVLPRIGALLASWGDNIAEFFVRQHELITEFWGAWFKQRGEDIDGLKDWIGENVVAPIDTWWEGFVAKILDFGSWVSALADAIWDWLQEDVPGHSPRKVWIWEDIGGFFYYWFGWYAEQVIKDPQRQATRVLTEGMAFLGDMFGEVAEVFWEAIDGYVKALGPTNPDIAESHSKALSSLGLSALTGLAGMTMAGSWLKPLGGAGMGQIAAMIYDMTNYKVITGAGITALTIAAIKTPMTYHFNELFRPNILPARDFMELMSRRAFTEPATLRNPALTSSVQALTGGGGEAYEQRIIGYYGYPAEYFGLFRELANTPLRYFPLAGIARTGFYDKAWYEEALGRSGYSRTAKDALLVMYEKMTKEALQGAMSGAAVTRFKEGFSDEVQFKAEMELLGYSEDQFKVYLAAAKLDYATDYTRDLLSSYQTAVRSGRIDLDQFRTKLNKLSIVPERVEAYVLKERARIKPEEELVPTTPPKPEYETDAGKVQVDTIRRRRRKWLISRGEEISALIALGMAPGYAEAVADNDDERLSKKPEE